jgi:hypothetical protein
MTEEINTPQRLVSYMDETGHSEDPRCHFAGMAGFICSQHRWEGLAEYWQKVLDHFKLKEPFHMKDFAGCRGQFSEWRSDEKKRRLLLDALVQGILAIKPTPVGTIVSIEDYRGLSMNQQSCFRDPYYMAFQRCTRGAALDAMGLEPETVSMVYAYNNDFGALNPQEIYSVDQAGAAEQLWQTMKSSTDFGKWMGSYGVSTPAKNAQLQAADLFAYELSKEFEMLRVRPDGQMRWALRQILSLVDYPFAFISLLDRLEMLRIIIESDWPCKENTEEVADPEIQMASAREKMKSWLKDRAGLTEIAV